jgi:adenine C2-methylase RlmN of 23S rRNA A2503 and tRNA A37
MLDNRLFSLRARQVTVSSVGVIDKIARLASDFPRVSFALSLHAPTQALREHIVPSAKAYKLPRLLDAVRGYQAATGQRVFVEYVMLAGVNDGDENARLLGALLAGVAVHVNLIPWNPVLSPEFDFAPPGHESVCLRALARCG